jgi:DNA-binding CsgD family transcriptional regulator
MDNKKIMRLNAFINNAYECTNFLDFLRLAITGLHKFVMYESGMFYCAISHDCSYFKPYDSGDIDKYYIKEKFTERESYLEYAKEAHAGKEAYVYKPIDYLSGIIKVTQEPRRNFLEEQNKYHIVCIRIVYQGQFLGEIYLHREKAKPDFTDNDLFVLSLLQPHISTIFNIIHTQITSKAMEQGNHNINIGMCAFDGGLTIISANVAGLEMLKNVTIFGSSVLHHIKELCIDISGKKSKIHNRVTEIIKTKNSHIKLDLFTYPPGIGDHICHITILQYTSESQINSDYRFKFTKREADIIDGLIQGKNNAQLASNLSLSENTIKTHIKSIYSKTGANNRTELTYLLMLNK